MKPQMIKNKRIKLILIIVFLILAITVGIILINNLNSNHRILLKLTKDIEDANILGAEADKKIYVSVYDGEQIKRYESTFNQNISYCLSDIEKKIDCNLNENYVRLDITREKYKKNSLIDMANSKNTLSYYYEKGNVYDLTKYQIGKVRNIKDINIKEDVIIETYNYMLKQIQSDGTFVYGANLDSGKVSDGYNIIRHCGSLWSLLECYSYLYENGKESDFNLLKSTYDYIYKNNIHKKDENTDFIFTSSDTCKIGSNALMILASVELYNITGDKVYLDNSDKLANGIIYLQDEDGSFYHITNDIFEKTGKNNNVIYSGEINFALIKLYEKTNNEAYLKSVLKSMDYFINEKNVNTKNQWFAYFYVELIKYVKDYKYMQNFIKDMDKNLSKIDNGFNRCDMEYLGCCYLYLNEILNNYKKYPLVNEISKKEINKLIEHVCKTYINRAQKGLSNYATIENSMFFYNVDSCKGAFFEDDYFARIDVSQHNLSGYKMFYEHLYDNNKLIYDQYEEAKDKKTNTKNVTNNELNQAYVDLAKQAVETYVSTGKTISVPKNLPEEMYEKCKNGVYVGIHNNDELRGCRGSFSPKGTIAEEVIKYAINAATNDKRYSPIEKKEFDYLIYEVSILSDPEEVNDLDELNVKKYGIIIEKDNKRGTMLPNRESISTVEEQIRKTLKKAGLAENEENYKLYKFETISYKGK